MNNQTIKNTAAISPEGFIEIKVVDIDSLGAALEIGRKVLSVVTILEDEGRPVKILIDSSQEKSWGEIMIPVLTIIFKDMKFKKGAIYGSNSDLRKLQEKVLTKANIGKERGQIFDTREKAVSWLSKD